MIATLTDKQREANRLLASPVRNIMLRGGSRSGKTFLIVRAVIQRALNAPGSRHVIFRFRFNAAKTSVWSDTIPKVLKLCFPTLRCRFDKTDFFLALPNGSQIWIAGLDDKERVEKILGQEFATIVFNESSQIPWGSVETAMSRLAQRVELAPEIAAATGRKYLNLKAYFDCNPPSKLHWSYSLFRAGLKPGTKEKLPNPADYAEMKVNPADNADNLPPEYFEVLASMSAARRLRFEAGEWASEVNGALWSLEDRAAPDGKVMPGIDAGRLASAPEMRRIVVSVDPSGTRGDGQGDDIGIVVVGLGVDGRGHVLEDATCNMSPEGWGRRAVALYHKWGADRVVAERNYGGDMVRFTIATADKNVAFKEVTASRGKSVRAEPISALYEQGRVSHVGQFPDLEDQMCNFTASGYVGEGSPDRCFVAGTLVETNGGPMPIEKVKEGDQVWTRKGLRKVLASGMTDARAKVFDVSLSDGTVLTGTGNHPVFVEGCGFTRLDALVWGDIINHLRSNKEWRAAKQHHSRVRNMFDTLIAAVNHPAATFTAKAVSGLTKQRFTAMFGRTRMDRSRKDGMSTTSTWTQEITALKTWLCFPHRLMRSNTRLNTAKNSRHIARTICGEPLTHLRRGIEQMRGVKSTLALGLIHGKFAFRSAVSVLNVDLNTITSPTGTVIGFAHARASASTTNARSATTKIGNALSVERRSTSKRASLKTSAPVRVVGLSEKSGRVPVFNLTVEGENEYYANGILVHNCDALVWALTELMLGTETWYEPEKYKSAW